MPLIDALSAAALRTLSEARPQELSNFSWSFATLKVDDRPLLHSIAAAAMEPLSAFSVQDLSNTAWSFAVLHFHDAPLLDAIAAASLRLLADDDTQALVNPAWAYAVLLIRHEPLLDAIAAAAMRTSRDFHTQALANTAWAVSTLAISNLPLMSSIAPAALRKLSAFSAQDLANTSWAYANLSICDPPLMDAIAASARRKLGAIKIAALSLEDAHRLALDLTALAWAFAFLGRLPQAVAAGVFGTLVAIGREVDRRVAAAVPGRRLAATGKAPVLVGQYDGYLSAHEAAMASLPKVSSRDAGAMPGTPVGTPPAMVLDTPGAVVVYKPVGWEVDSTGGGDNRLLLSSFLQETFSKERCPLVHSPDFGYGFLHRLDVPSSGLILAATSFEGLYSLRGQLNTYRLEREYVTLCHALAPPASEVDARVDATSTRVLRSAVSDVGRPASSRLLTPAQLLIGGSRFSIVAVRIRTGRRHQIRAHTRHVGHPTAADSWYCPEACALRVD